MIMGQTPLLHLCFYIFHLNPKAKTHYVTLIGKKGMTPLAPPFSYMKSQQIGIMQHALSWIFLFRKTSMVCPSGRSMLFSLIVSIIFFLTPKPVRHHVRTLLLATLGLLLLVRLCSSLLLVVKLFSTVLKPKSPVSHASKTYVVFFPLASPE